MIHAETFTIGAGLSCDFSDLQVAIDLVMANQDVENELRLVNDGSFDDKSYSVIFEEIKHIRFQGGYANCEGAESDSVAGKTILDSENNITNAPIFSIVSTIIPDPVAGRPMVELSNLILMNSHSESGGAVYIENVWSEINHTEFINNQAANGGAVYCKADLFFTFLVFRHTRFLSNQAQDDGGAVYLAGNSPQNNSYGCSTYLSEQFTASEEILFESNIAGQNGGAVYVGDYLADTLFGGGTFHHNSSFQGGALYMKSGISSLAGNFFSNIAEDKGGAVFMTSSENQPTQTSFSNSQFIDNSAGNSAGAIYLENSLANVLQSILDNNHAPVAAVAESYGNLSFSGSEIIFHHQSTNLFFGDSSDNTNSKLRIFSSEIRNNTNLQNLIDFPKGSVKIATSYIVENQTSQHMIVKGENVFNNSQNTDLFDFLTVSGNSLNGSVFQFSNNIVELKNNILWQPGQDLFTGLNINAIYNCNLVSHHSAKISGVHNIISEPEFKGGIPYDYHIRISSPAIDYCESGHIFEFSVIDADGDNGQLDISFIPDEFGPVDIGADQIDTSDIIFANGF